MFVLDRSFLETLSFFLSVPASQRAFCTINSFPIFSLALLRLCQQRRIAFFDVFFFLFLSEKSKTKNSGAHSRVATLIQPSFQKERVHVLTLSNTFNSVN